MSASPLIQVRNAQRKLRVDTERLASLATRAFQTCGRLPGVAADKADAWPEISVVLVSDRRMAALHRRFMNIAGPTDVLTFQHGEIVVSVETAQQNAARFKTTVEDEIQLYIVHGFLHLFGFDDRTTAQARRMQAAQEKVWRALRLSREHKFLRGRRLN